MGVERVGYAYSLDSEFVSREVVVYIPASIVGVKYLEKLVWVG